jgi:hypothetical protein
MLPRSPAQSACALLVLLAFAGCASTSSVPQYAASTSDTARLRIALSKGTVPQTSVGDGMTAFLHTAEDCSAPAALASVYTLDSGPAEHTPERRNHRKAGKLGMPLGDYDGLEVKELLIEAGPNKSVALQFSVLLAGPLGAFTRCNISLEQDFVAGRDYEIVGRFDSLSSCSAVVNELVSEDGGPARKQIASVNSQSNPLNPTCFVKY